MQLRDVEDFYPLSPLQQGLLFHSLSDPGSGMYFNQTLLSLGGDLDVEAFRSAWQRVVDLHPILRTFFVWEGVEEPVQVVRKAAEMPFAVEDGSALSEAQRTERLEALRASDLARGFQLSQAPLMRATLVRTGADRHELLWSFHHILMDGWSMFRVLQQVFGAYDALVAGRAPRLERSPLYRNHIAWLKQQDKGRAEAFWREYLAGFAAPTPLPVDADAPASNGTGDGSTDFDVRIARVDNGATARLVELARAHRLTLNTVLQGAWALLLARSSGEDDVLFGTIVSGRPPEVEGVEAMVGLFINSLPARVKVDDDAPLLDWLGRLQVELADLREHESSPLAEVQGWSEVAGGTQLFDSLFLFENYKKDSPLEEMTEALEIRDVVWYERHNYPIAAVAIPGDEIELRLVFQTDRYTPAAIERMLGHWRTLLEQMAARPEGKVGALEMLTAAERELVTTTWNDTAAEIPDVCAHALFEAQVDRAPDAVAVEGGGRTLTYGELEREANRLAHRLQDLGVGPGELVAICTGRTPEMVVGVLAALKAGGAYVPLDTGLPPQRLAYMLENSGARVVLTRSDMLASLPEHGAATVVMNAEAEALARLDASRPAAAVGPRDLAYVIYTSGSTGVPKGVELEHRGLVNLLTWHQRAYDVKPSDRATHLAGLGFDAAVWELWPYLTAGSALVLVPDEARLVPENLLAFFAEQRITQAFIPTPMCEALLREEIPADLPLEVVLTGGDKLNRAPDRELPFRLFNQYGPTENTVVATAIEVPPAPDDDSAPSIGRPIQNVRCFLLDRAGRPVPVGVAGELFIGGASLARGYRGNPALTAEKFVPAPAGLGADGERLYATGDMARWRPTGEIDFLGRGDAQVKVRGYRIELGEIEVVLARHPAVRETVVLAREDVPGNKQLVAYLVAEPGPTPSEADLRAHLAASLPDYMVPAAFVTLDAFPLSGSGKVDRKALPAPEAGRREQDPSYAAPTADVEKRIAAIWQEALGLERVGLHDNFFDLGGHSLLLIKVHGKLKAALATDIPMVDLFQYPTVRTLADHLGGASSTAPAVPVEAAQRVEAGRDRLRQMQQRRRGGGKG